MTRRPRASSTGCVRCLRGDNSGRPPPGDDQGHGYERATIRAIAAQAKVDPALVHHYFGTKDKLMVAALELPINPRDVVAEVIAGDPNEIGERLLRRVLAVWGEEWAGGGPSSD